MAVLSVVRHRYELQLQRVIDAYIVFSFLWFLTYIVYQLGFTVSLYVDYIFFACMAVYMFVFFCLFTGIQYSQWRDQRLEESATVAVHPGDSYATF